MNADMLTGGGIGALVVAVVYAGKLLLEWRRDQAAQDADDDTRPITNAAQVNEMLVQSMERLIADSDRTHQMYREAMEKLGQMESQIARERLVRERMSKRLDEHDSEIGFIKRQFALAVSYIRSLLAFITAHDLADQAPEPPAGLHLD